jgi:energy-coupling factor transporter ATP-binding protein EcfA2
MSNELIYRIRRVRLINFHNFVDEIVEINNGGHLFLLGDNGSGKTTLLDAIHLVLTANEDVEFNAAARVAGSTRDGRRLQGIIMRQNIESAVPLNPTGGITYAAIEIDGWQGKPLTLAIGLKADSLIDQVQYWGVVRSCALDELRLYRDENGERFPLSRRELREELAGSGFYQDLKSYRAELIRRLYGNEDLFKESCRLLKMGKAYREIAAGTSDYHELFKKLLPDPQRELFERVIRTLKELDQSKNDLAGLEEKQNYLESLHQTVIDIDKYRETALRYDWLIHYLTCKQLNQNIIDSHQSLKNEENELSICENNITLAECETDEMQRQLSVLQQKDASGLLNLQQERKREEIRLKNDYIQCQNIQTTGEKELIAAQRQHREAILQWNNTIKHFYDLLNKYRIDLPFSISSLLGEIDSLRSVQNLSEINIPDTSLYIDTAQQEMVRLGGEDTNDRNKLEKDRDDLNRLNSEIEQLVKQEEIIPQILKYAEVMNLLNRNLIQAKPLYSMLEWKPGLSADARIAYEEAIGQDVLATFAVSGQDYAKAASLIFPDYPGIRLANRDEAQNDPPSWIRESFDISTSDPAAIRILADEMITRVNQPPVSVFQHGVNILRMRSHERHFEKNRISFIGINSRREAMRKKVKQLQDDKKLIEKDIREYEKKINNNSEKLILMKNITGIMSDIPLKISDKLNSTTKMTDKLLDAEKRLESQQKELESVSKRLNDCISQLDDLNNRISNEGLDKLEQKQKKINRDIIANHEKISELNKKSGVISEKIAEITRNITRLSDQIQSKKNTLNDVEIQLSPFAVAVESVEYYVLRTCSGNQFTSIENVTSASDRVKRDEAEEIGGLRHNLHHPTYGALYSFVYDDSINLLIDRYSKEISDVVTEGQRQIVEQNEIISEHTRELIRDIIMGDLFTELRSSVSKLRSMVKKINHLLNRRVFGSNRYRFRIDPERNYRGLLEVIEKYNPHDPSAQDELKTFLDIHKDEIMTTEVNDIPAALDYRNWFRYELDMISETDNGVVAMDRKTKGLGSGGEQAVPNYLLILTVSHFLYDGNNDLRHRALLFDEAFYGIDAGRRDQLLGFASDIGLQLFVASPDLDGVKKEIPCSTTLLVVKDESCDIHLYPYDFNNLNQLSLFEGTPDAKTAEFGSATGDNYV